MDAEMANAYELLTRDLQESRTGPGDMVLTDLPEGITIEMVQGAFDLARGVGRPLDEDTPVFWIPTDSQREILLHGRRDGGG